MTTDNTELDEAIKIASNQDYHPSFTFKKALSVVLQAAQKTRALEKQVEMAKEGLNNIISGPNHVTDTMRKIAKQTLAQMEGDDG